MTIPPDLRIYFSDSWLNSTNEVSSDGPRPLIYFHAVEGKWTLGERLGEVEYRHDDSSSGPPLEQWNRSSGEPGLSVSVIPQMLLVEGDDEDVNGTYVRCENYNDRPLFRCVGRQGSVLKFDGGEWWMQKSGLISGFCPRKEYGPPICAWNGGSTVSVVQLPFPEAPRFLWVQGAGEWEVNDLYACTHSHHGKPRYVQVDSWGSIFFDDVCWKLGRASFGSSWSYKTCPQSTSVPPTTGWTNEECPGEDPPPELVLQESYSEIAPSIESPSQPGERSSQPPFLLVAGAGLAAVNGRYACVGSFGGEPKYKQLGGSSIIHYTCGRWQLSQHDSVVLRDDYVGPVNRTPLPTSGWQAVVPRNLPAPQVSLGTQQDLQTGDRVLMVKASFRGFDFPPGSEELIIGSSPVRCSIGRLQGDFFSTEIHPDKLVPLGALGSIEFNRCWHRISDPERTLSSSASAPARVFGTSTAAGSSRAARQEEEQTAEPEGGFDEEWCPDQDVDRFRCCICMLVARDAMVHECGAVLFCELCWVKCQADSSNCPVCREDGSSMVPSHGDRRLIRNLMIMCPNKCGESFPLCEKDWLKKMAVCRPCVLTRIFSTKML